MADNLANILNNHSTIKSIKKDFNQLKVLSTADVLPINSQVGSKTTNHFTLSQRLRTKGCKGISFLKFYIDFDEVYSSQKPVKKMLEYYQRVGRIIPDDFENLVKIKKYIFNCYYGAINIFRPIVAIDLFRRFNPKCVLDPCCGWGGRLIAAAAFDVPEYIGIDNNHHLAVPYKNMMDFLKDKTSTKMTFINDDCLKVDYLFLGYDMVFTSPPYYNIEIYGDEPPYKTKDEWDKLFYKPLIERTYEYLQPNGVFCLNVNDEIYNRACIPVLGECYASIPLSKRNRNNEYSESLYIWHKPDI